MAEAEASDGMKIVNYKFFTVEDSGLFSITFGFEKVKA